MKNLKSKNVLITGGASGIGKIMARLMLERGANVMIWDINQENMDSTLHEFNKLGKILSHKVDISNLEEVKQAARITKQELGIVDVLINNAGVVVGKYFHEYSNGDIDKTMAINSLAPMHIALEFITDMLEKNEGHICNIASSAGLISNPKMSVYIASKWSVVGWSDSLRIEMQQMDTNVKVTTIMPYYIDTGMFDGVKSRLPVLKPEASALTIVKAIEKDIKMLTLPGYIYRFTRISQALLPLKVFDWFADSVLGIYKTMEHFTGRK